MMNQIFFLSQISVKGVVSAGRDRAVERAEEASEEFDGADSRLQHHFVWMKPESHCK